MEDFQTIYGQWILGGRRDLKSSHSITYIFHWSSLEIGWYLISEGLGSGPLLWLFVPIPSPLHKWAGWWFRKSAYSKKGREEKPLSPRKGYKKSSSTTELFLKDICLLVLQLLFAAKDSLISFITHCVCACVCVERETHTHTHHDLSGFQLSLAIPQVWATWMGFGDGTLIHFS